MVLATHLLHYMHIQILKAKFTNNIGISKCIFFFFLKILSSNSNNSLLKSDIFSTCTSVLLWRVWLISHVYLGWSTKSLLKAPSLQQPQNQPVIYIATMPSRLLLKPLIIWHGHQFKHGQHVHTSLTCELVQKPLMAMQAMFCQPNFSHKAWVN